ncbi:MAG: sialidase family protein [Candidatus Nitrosocosmicus sp.]
MKVKVSIILSIFILTFISTISVVIHLQSSYAYTWPCIDRSEGKAPIATSGNNVYVAWWGNKTGNYEVMFKASNDGGKTFGDKINLSNSTKGISVEADVAASGNNVYVTYADNKTGVANAYIRVSNDNGKTFGPELQLTDNVNLAKVNNANEIMSYNKKTSPYELKVAASGNNVYVIATGSDSNNNDNNKSYQPDVFIRTSNDGGKTFGKDINLSQSPGATSNRIEIEAIGDKVYATWWDKGADGSDTPLIRVSQDNGHTFGDIIVLTDTSPPATNNINSLSSKS